MDPIKQRLVNAFAAVFPDLSEEEIASASQASVATWDSVAALTLLNVIEEEFGIQVDIDVLPDLVSFDLILDYLKSRPDAAA